MVKNELRNSVVLGAVLGWIVFALSPAFFETILYKSNVIFIKMGSFGITNGLVEMILLGTLVGYIIFMIRRNK